MWAVTGIDKDTLDYFDRDHCFVSFFLTDKYDQEVVGILAQNFEKFNQMLGECWHLLMPYNGQTAALNSGIESHRVGSTDFNEELAYEIAKYYGISTDSFPCILFEFGDEKPLIFEVPSNNRDVRIMFETLSKKITNFWFENNPDLAIQRSYLSKEARREVVFKLAKRHLKSNIKKPKTYFKLLPFLKNLAS